ncbi:hypothetical protein [Burkholderia alba]|nr:hypothetical protein [Burkholderia alba]
MTRSTGGPVAAPPVSRFTPGIPPKGPPPANEETALSGRLKSGNAAID